MASLSRQEFWNSELKSPLIGKINSATIKELFFPHLSKEQAYIVFKSRVQDPIELDVKNLKAS